MTGLKFKPFSQARDLREFGSMLLYPKTPGGGRQYELDLALIRQIADMQRLAAVNGTGEPPTVAELASVARALAPVRSTRRPTYRLPA
jgi:hypothetical protein